MLKRLGFAAAIAMLMAGAAPAAASVTVTISQVGADVVATTSGTIDVTGLTDDGTYSLNSAVAGSFVYVGTGTEGDLVEGYFGDFSTVVGPDTVGPGDFTSATSGFGTPFAFNYGGFGEPYVFTPVGYTGGLLSATSTFANTTLTALGLDSGHYVYTLPNDTFTLDIGTSAVPEPASWALMIGGIGLVGAMMRRKHNSIVSNVAFA